MSLLKRYSQRRESVFGGEALIGSGPEKESDDAVVILLGGHV